jgi:hypothetical protein
MSGKELGRVRHQRSTQFQQGITIVVAMVTMDETVQALGSNEHSTNWPKEGPFPAVYGDQSRQW